MIDTNHMVDTVVEIHSRMKLVQIAINNANKHSDRLVIAALCMLALVIILPFFYKYNNYYFFIISIILIFIIIPIIIYFLIKYFKIVHESRKEIYDLRNLLNQMATQLKSVDSGKDGF